MSISISGAAQITFTNSYTPTDSGNEASSDTFYLTVNKVNDAPTLMGCFPFVRI